MSTQEQNTPTLTEAIRSLKNHAVKSQKYGCAILLRMAELESERNTDIQQRHIIEEVLNVAMNMGEPERRQYLFDNYMIFKRLESKHP